jgi:hypothetical protein
MLIRMIQQSSSSGSKVLDALNVTSYPSDEFSYTYRIFWIINFNKFHHSGKP